MSSADFIRPSVLGWTIEYGESVETPQLTTPPGEVPITSIIDQLAARHEAKEKLPATMNVTLNPRDFTETEAPPAPDPYRPDGDKAPIRRGVGGATSARGVSKVGPLKPAAKPRAKRATSKLF